MTGAVWETNIPAPVGVKVAWDATHVALENAMTTTQFKPRARLTNGQWEVRSVWPGDPCKGYAPNLQTAIDRFIFASWQWSSRKVETMQAKAARHIHDEMDRIHTNGGW